ADARGRAEEDLQLPPVRASLLALDAPQQLVGVDAPLFHKPEIIAPRRARGSARARSRAARRGARACGPRSAPRRALAGARRGRRAPSRRGRPGTPPPRG